MRRYCLYTYGRAHGRGRRRCGGPPARAHTLSNFQLSVWLCSAFGIACGRCSCNVSVSVFSLGSAVYITPFSLPPIPTLKSPPTCSVFPRRNRRGYATCARRGWGVSIRGKESERERDIECSASQFIFLFSVLTLFPHLIRTTLSPATGHRAPSGQWTPHRYLQWWHLVSCDRPHSPLILTVLSSPSFLKITRRAPLER